MTDILITRRPMDKARVSVQSRRALRWALDNLALRPGDSGVTIDAEHIGQFEREINAAGMSVDVR